MSSPPEASPGCTTRGSPPRRSSTAPRSGRRTRLQQLRGGRRRPDLIPPAGRRCLTSALAAVDRVTATTSRSGRTDRPSTETRSVPDSPGRGIRRRARRCSPGPPRDRRRGPRPPAGATSPSPSRAPAGRARRTSGPTPPEAAAFELDRGPRPADRPPNSGQATRPTRKVAAGEHQCDQGEDPRAHLQPLGLSGRPSCTTPQKPMKPMTASWIPCHPRAETRSSTSRWLDGPSAVRGE